MRKLLTTFLAFFVAFAMFSCSDDNGVNIIDVGNGGDDNGNGNGGEELGTVYSISVNVDGGGKFTFAVDMDGATIEGDDAGGFEGDSYTFDPENDKVFIAGGVFDPQWEQPGTNGALQLTREGASPNVTVAAGSGEFKFFIVPPGVTNDDEVNATWAYGEWDGNPNRSVEIESGGEFSDVWAISLRSNQARRQKLYI